MKFGPGTLKIGATGSEIDISCLVNGAVIGHDKDEGDSRTALCGTVRAGTTSYSWALSGNMDIDPEDPDGLFMLAATEYGSEQPFVFTPNNAGQVTARGVLVLDPLDFGDGDDDAFGNDMTSDFEFTLVGAPTYSPTAVEPVDATGATAGTPGTFTPLGSVAPDNVAGMTGLTANPNTAWTTGQYVQTKTAGTAGQSHWSATAWVAGPA